MHNGVNYCDPKIILPSYELCHKEYCNKYLNMYIRVVI